MTWLDQEGNLINHTLFTSAQYTSPNFVFTWTHAEPSLVDHFELEWANDRGDWIIFATYENTSSGLSIPNTNFIEKDYFWRLKTIYTSYQSETTCFKKVVKPYTGFGNSTLSLRLIAVLAEFPFWTIIDLVYQLLLKSTGSFLSLAIGI